jgi:hypothetical protein
MPKPQASRTGYTPLLRPATAGGMFEAYEAARNSGMNLFRHAALLETRGRMKKLLSLIPNAIYSFLAWFDDADAVAQPLSARAPLSARNRGGSALPRAADDDKTSSNAAAASSTLVTHRPRALSAVAGLRAGVSAAPASAASAFTAVPAAASASAGSDILSARGSAFDSVSAFVASLPSALRPDTKRAVHAARRAQSAVGAAPARVYAANAEHANNTSDPHAMPSASTASAAQQWAQQRAPSAGAAYRSAVLGSLRAGAGHESAAEDSAVRWSTAEKIA